MVNTIDLDFHEPHSNSSISRHIDDEIEAAFAAGKMPPDWKPRLLASGLSKGNVSAIVTKIDKVHEILHRPRHKVAISVAAMVFFFLAGASAGVVGLVFLLIGSEHNKEWMGLLLFVALLLAACTALIAYYAARDLKDAIKIRDSTRRVLKRNLLPPV
uniref:Uncharacterized protein n=1 Tax=Leersia perrieri TaxID=77586 RepID=A0A0D9XGE5_9ORYZ